MKELSRFRSRRSLSMESCDIGGHQIRPGGKELDGEGAREGEGFGVGDDFDKHVMRRIFDNKENDHNDHLSISITIGSKRMWAEARRNFRTIKVFSWGPEGTTSRSVRRLSRISLISFDFICTLVA